VIIKFCLVFPKIFLLHKVVRDAKKVEKHWSRQLRSHSFYAMSKWSCFDLLLITLLWPTFHFFVGDLKFCKVDQVNYMFCVPAHFLYRGATIVSVLTWKMKDEKRKNVLLRWLKQSQEKIKFRGLWEERCNRIWAKRLTQDLYKCDYFSR